MKNKTFCFQILHVHRAHMKYYHSFLNLAQVCEKKVKTMIFVSGPPVRASNSTLSWPDNQVCRVQATVHLTKQELIPVKYIKVIRVVIWFIYNNRKIL